MSKLKEAAKAVAGQGGEYIKLDDLRKQFPHCITINGAHMRIGREDEMPCLTFAEDPTKYFYAVSGDLAAIFNAWIKICGDVESLNDELKKEPVRLRIYKTRTRTGNQYTKVQVMDDAPQPAKPAAEKKTEPPPEETLPF